MTAAAIAAAFLAGAGVAAIVAQHRHICGLLVANRQLTIELHAAERDLRLVRNAQTDRRVAPLTIPDVPAPAPDWLDQWDTAVDGLPWRTWMFGMPTMDTIDDPDSYLPRVAPEPAALSEALARAYRRISTAEVRAVVEGAA